LLFFGQQADHFRTLYKILTQLKKENDHKQEQEKKEGIMNDAGPERDLNLLVLQRCRVIPVS
jgi:hypothetical protein